MKFQDLKKDKANFYSKKRGLKISLNKKIVSKRILKIT
jgi:hypothetical protein